MTADSPRVPEAAQPESPCGVGAPDKERPDAREIRLAHIRREVGHASNTFWPSGDSWIQGYAEDCAWLLAELELVESALNDLTAERRPSLAQRIERLEAWAEDASRWSDDVVSALESAQ